jgi:histidinol-phosphate aminotransferase
MSFDELLRKEVKNVPAYVPGKSIEEVKQEFGLEKIIKLASNENPYGPSQKVIRALKDHLNNLNVYPRIDIPELRDKIGEYTGVDRDQVVLGAGVDGVLETLFKLFIRKGDEVIIPSPTFPYYEILSAIYGGMSKYEGRNENYDIDPDRIVADVTSRTKLIILCSPNNPTGNSIPNNVLKEILERVHCMVVVDEAYAEFADWNALELVSSYENLIITRTFSKAFGLAGLRIGYGLLPEWLVPEYMKINPPFSTGNLAIGGAMAALEDVKYMKSIVRIIKKERERLIKELCIHTYPSQGNFLMADVSPFSSSEFTETLMKKGVIIRDLKRFRGAGTTKIRISVGKPEENDLLIKSIKEIVKC